MTRDEFQKLTSKGILLLDGATGTNLQKAGLGKGVCPDLWILEHPDVIKKLQREYLEAGSDVVYSPTFSSNRVKLSEYGLEDRLPEMNKSLAAISKEVTREFMKEHPGSSGKYVAGNISMTGVQVEPVGPMKFEELVDIYKEQIRYLEEGGADLIVVETMMSLQETRAAVIACREVSELPIIATMTFEEDGRTLYGTDPVTALIVLQSLGADAFGANCSTGPDRMVPIIESLSEIAKIPVICKPNAGLPKLGEDGNTYYDLSPEDFRSGMERILEAGARIVGGCCGSSPEYIRAIADLKDRYRDRANSDAGSAAGEVAKKGAKSRGKDGEAGGGTASGMRYLASERRHLAFPLDGRFLIIGERINPTGKKKLQEELRNGSFNMVETFAEEQEERGADILDVNMGMSGIDEKAMMLEAIKVVTLASSLPLCIDTSYPEIMEAALRAYPGRALINSISAESDRCDRLLQTAKKYGAMFILLPVGDEGLPKDLEEKKKNIDLVLEKAYAMGFTKEDIMVDGLVGAVGAVKSAALDTLETIRYCHDMGLATTCGLSNISFGLPQRVNVNTAFLSMAIGAHLTSAIINPAQDAMIRTVLSSDLLMNHPEGDVRYIEYMNDHEEMVTVPKSAVVTGDTKASATAQAPGGGTSGGRGSGTAAAPAVSDEVKEAVMKGRKGSIEQITKKALEDGRSADSILNDSLIPAINEVGDLFDKGTYFLPQLISSAETMEMSIGILEPHLQKGGGADDAPVVVIATVEGDIHDIGKNLVVLMLKNHGYRVMDLGKNVPKEVIVDTAMEEGAALIGLSALMTTTMSEMKNVVQYAKEKGYKGKIMIGGAVVTDDYRQEIGADGYSRDASEAVKVAASLVGI